MDAYTVDGVRRLEEMGATDVIVGFRWTYEGRPVTPNRCRRRSTRSRRYADTVIAAAR